MFAIRSNDAAPMWLSKLSSSEFVYVVDSGRGLQFSSMEGAADAVAMLAKHHGRTDFTIMNLAVVPQDASAWYEIPPDAFDDIQFCFITSHPVEADGSETRMVVSFLDADDPCIAYASEWTGVPVESLRGQVVGFITVNDDEE